jgi:isopenicillin N synthase-like dioxygenase
MVADSKKFLSFSNDPTHPLRSNNATIRDYSSTWEQFVLIKNGDGSVCLQDVGNRFLSPRTLAAGEPWIARSEAPAGGWERLYFSEHARRPDAPALISSFFISSKPGAHTPLYLTTNGDLVTTSSDRDLACAWELIILLPPVLSMLSVGGHAGLGAALHRASAASLSAAQREAAFVHQVLRSMLDVGAFYVTGHGVSGGEELLQTLQQNIGRLPYKDDALAGDATFKQNTALVEQTGWGPAAERAVHGYPTLHADVDATSVRELCSAVFDGSEALSDALLHALALGQEISGGGAAQWRGHWRHERAQVALRALAYNPGPLLRPDSSEVVTTARHTDSTWLTVLRQDSAGGLQIRPPGLASGPSARVPEAFVDARPPLAGALLVNAGNILQTASNGFFRAVCHRVVRTSESATRVSLIFFYDRHTGDEFHAGGTGGC